MVFVENVLQIRLGTDKNVFVFLDTTKSRVFAEHVTLIALTMVETVFVIMDSLEMLINANHAILAVENVKALKKINVLLVPM